MIRRTFLKILSILPFINIYNNKEYVVGLGKYLSHHVEIDKTEDIVPLGNSGLKYVVFPSEDKLYINYERGYECYVTFNLKYNKEHLVERIEKLDLSSLRGDEVKFELSIFGQKFKLFGTYVYD